MSKHEEIKKIVSSFKRTCTIQEGEPMRRKYTPKHPTIKTKRDSHQALFYELQFGYGSGLRWTGPRNRAA